MRTRTFATLLMMVLLALSAAAGEERCDYEATACVKYIVDSMEKKGWIGIEVEYGEDKSATIHRVVPDSPAEAAGLVPGDVLLAMNGVVYSSATKEQLAEAKKTMVPGNEASLTIRRGGEDTVVVVTLARIPESVLAQWVGSHVLEGHRHQLETASTDTTDAEDSTE